MIDWTPDFIRAEQLLREASDCFLLKQYDKGLIPLLQAKQHLERVQDWVLSQE